VRDVPPLLVVVLSGAAERWGCPRDESPLALAATPHLDALAEGGRVLGVRLVTHEREATSAVPLLSILGLDPARHARARASWLGALLRTAPGRDEVLCSADFVALFRDIVADVEPGPFSAAEIDLLLEAARGAVAPHGITLFPGEGSHHLAAMRRDAVDAALPAPERVLGRHIADFEPGTASHRAAHAAARAVLDSHEINVVRRDLGHNGADAVWIWGPGPVGSIAAAAWKGHAAAFGTDAVWRGLWRAAGAACEPRPEGPDALRAALERSLQDFDYVFLHDARARADAWKRDLGARCSGLADIDRDCIGPARAAVEAAGARLMVVPDIAIDTRGARPLGDPVPVLIAGAGLAPLMTRSFDEHGARSAGQPIEPGHGLLAYVHHL